MLIDLHTHSHFSDGEHSPKDMITEATNKGLSVFSITDHNFLPETTFLKDFSKKNNIKFIEGIEISTLLKSSNLTLSLHVLGYGKKLDAGFLNKNLSETVHNYNQRAHSIVNKLNKEFPTLKLDFESLKAHSQEIYISRNTLARLLVEHLKNVISIRDALKQYVFVKEDDSWMITPEKSFQLIIDAGGVPILAHSGRELRRMGLPEYEKMIARLAEVGLLGLEAYCPKHTKEEIDMIKSIANKFNLYITGGSDWHGKTYTPNIKMGFDFFLPDIIPFLNNENICAD